MIHSVEWLKEHEKDPYVKRARKEAYFSRAAFKLLELHEKYHLFKSGMKVIDLGASPGGWSQVAKDLIGSQGWIIMVDLLPMPSIPGTEFIEGDFNDAAVFHTLQERVKEKTDNGCVDLVISDMAPNISGIKSVDQSRSLHLVELAWECAKQLLVPGGTFLAKIFQGGGMNTFLSGLRPYFRRVKLEKPSASRRRSSEVYIFANEFLGYNQ